MAEPAGTSGRSHAPRESTPIVSTITKVPTIRYGRRGAVCSPKARGRALTQPTLPFLVYLRERIGKTVDDRAIADPFSATRALAARPCRIERAEVPGLGPCGGDALNLASGSIFNGLTYKDRFTRAAGPQRNTCS